jgi:hypothetical protein
LIEDEDDDEEEDERRAGIPPKKPLHRYILDFAKEFAKISATRSATKRAIRYIFEAAEQRRHRLPIAYTFIWLQPSEFGL